MSLALVLAVLPALVAAAAIVAGVHVLATPGSDPETRGARTLRAMYGALLLLIALGIGTCYAVVLVDRPGG